MQGVLILLMREPQSYILLSVVRTTIAPFFFFANNYFLASDRAREYNTPIPLCVRSQRIGVKLVHINPLPIESLNPLEKITVPLSESLELLVGYKTLS